MPLTPPTQPAQHLIPRPTRRAICALAPRTHNLALLTLLLVAIQLTTCRQPDPVPLRGLYQGDPGALFDTLDFLPDNRVQIALHAHTHIHIQQGRYTLQGDTLKLHSERTTERLKVLPDGTIDGGPVLGIYRLATAPTAPTDR